MPGMTSGQLVRLRETMGLSVARFAVLLGVSPRAVYQWESGERRVTNRRAQEFLQDLYAEHLGGPLTRAQARLQVAQRLGVTLEAAGRLLVSYGRAPKEGWRDVVGRVVDGERYQGRKSRKPARV
jgi:transcriptional regulator with XRE-family HTH domain